MSAILVPGAWPAYIASVQLTVSVGGGAPPRRLSIATGKDFVLNR